MTDLNGKVALVTGASSGMGLATARLLSDRGARVFTAQRGKSEFEDIHADLIDADAPQSVVGVIAKKAGHLDILINNAGIMREGAADEMPIDDWHLQLQVNLTAPFLFIRHALPLMRGRQSAIVNTGSIEGLGNNPGHAAYGASKAGLHGLTRAIAVDEGPNGVRCNAVAPGWIDTPLNEDYIQGMPDPTRFRAEIGGIHPVGRTGSPKEVAELIVWLASPAASFVTGQIFTIDGGRTTKLSLP